MAFPGFVNSAATANTVTTNLVLNMPASIVAGNLLLAACRCTTTGTPAMTGWTKIGTTDSGSNRLVIFVKTAVGGDTGTFGDGGSTSKAGVVFQIDNWSGVLGDVVYAGGATTLNSGANSPGVTADWLWVVCSQNASNTTGAPTNYTNFLASNGSSQMSAAATRQLNASSEDPGVFAGTASNASAGTVRVPPRAATAGAFFPFFT